MATRPSVISKQTFCVTIALAALVGSMFTGISIVDKSNERRALFIKLTDNQNEQDQLLEERTRLLIERGALSAYQNVDRIAIDELKMRFPEGAEQVVSAIFQVSTKENTEDIQ